MHGRGWTTHTACAVTEASLGSIDTALANTTELLPSQEKWSVLYVRSRQEKALADDLRAMGISHFLPLVQYKKLYGKRKACVELPLFPGYLFLRGSVEDVYQADRTKRVSRIIPVIDQTKFDWELRNIQFALNHDATLNPFPSLIVGTRVEVRSGPLVGLEGVIEQRGRGDRLILQVDILGRATSVDIDGAELAPLD